MSVKRPPGYFPGVHMANHIESIKYVTIIALITNKNIDVENGFNMQRLVSYHTVRQIDTRVLCAKAMVYILILNHNYKYKTSTLQSE